MARRRRQAHELERVLGANALFATAYGNVGSSIYYALGVTAFFALGLTPVVFVIAGLFFAATAATYAEGTVSFPEAGGSSSFARHAFNEVVSFGAAWAQMLNYIITIAISAFFVPHYLSIFWEPLRTNPWDIVGGAVVIVVLVTLNIVGIQESARINVGLAAIDFATQVLLVLLGFVLVFSPHVLLKNVHFGTAPTWSHFLLAIPIAMIAYTGIETVSNLSEEARDPVRTIPRSILMVAIAVFAIYFTLPMVALSAMPVRHGVTVLGTKFAADPVLGVVEHLGIAGTLLSVLKIYVGLLAATILFIATNAGVIGASRITYAMAGYRQLPSIFRRLHPKFKTPWISLVVFAGFVSILVLLPGKTNFLGTMYSFGAMLSFTIAHASVIQLRRKQAGRDIPWRARPNFRWRGVDWPLFAVIGVLGTGLSWLDVVIQYPSTRYAGLGWIGAGFAVYLVYRRRILKVPLRETVRAPVEYGPAAALEFRSILVPIAPGYPSEEAMDFACRLAAERRASIVAFTAIQVPLELPLDTESPEEEREANEQLDEARAIGDSYGVRVTGRIARTRNIGRAIVDEAIRRNSEVIVMAGPRRVRLQRGRRQIFGDAVDFVLRHAPCRVMVATARERAA
ncbi:MAG TPA: universal stress protein [Gaiellaceae bacterium]|nr:universal stress protein [Gaiellaceae bacterium]